MNAERRLQDVLEEVGEEATAALAEYGEFNSAHEGWAVILEELDELWDEVRAKRSKRCPQRMRREAVQVAAAAAKFAATFGRTFEPDGGGS